MLWMQHVKNKEVLKEMETKRKIVLEIRKKQFKFLEHIRKENLENLTLGGHIQNNRGREKQCVAYLMSVCKWMAYLILTLILLRTTKDKTFVDSLGLDCTHPEVIQQLKEE